MKRLCALAAAAILVVTGCSGSDDDQVSTLPLPDKPPSAAGPATGPAMVPNVLLAASDELDSTLGDVDDYSASRQAGAFVSGKTAVGYSVDDISGYSLESGEQMWRADLDFGTGGVCFVSQPDTAVKQFTVVYRVGDLCDEVATISVSDGSVINESNVINDIPQFEGETAGGSVSNMFTVDGVDYLLDMHGVAWEIDAKGEPEAIAKLEARSYFDIYPTPGNDMLIGARLSEPGCPIDAYELPSFELAWTKTSDELFEHQGADCVTSAAAGNPAWLMQQGESLYEMVQLDPKTGELLGSDSAPVVTDGPPAKGEFFLASAANQFDRAFGMPNGDMIFSQAGGLIRYSLETGKSSWMLDMAQTELDESEDTMTLLTTVLPTDVTSDGYLIASVSNETDVEIDAINVETGELAARWPVPPEYRNGFQTEPGMTMFDGGIVMTRNFEAWESAFSNAPEPEGDRFDLGVFTFPDPDNEPAVTVPTVGPATWDAKPVSQIKAATPVDPAGARTFKTGEWLIAITGNEVRGIDPKTGKAKWTTPLPEGGTVCSTPRPDRLVKSFSLGVLTPDSDSRCTTLVQIKASDGEILETVQAESPDEAFGYIDTFEGKEYIFTLDGRVVTWNDGELVEHADVGRNFGYITPAASDKSLITGMVTNEDGSDATITAFRRPSYEQVWTTTALEVFGEIDSRNRVTSWFGNGLWFSATYGDTADYNSTIEDVLVELDPETGAVAHQTERTARDYGVNDPTKFSMTFAWASSFEAVGFSNGDMLVDQNGGLMRYSLAEDDVRWFLDTSSIENSMETTSNAASIGTDMALVDGGDAVLVTYSNKTSVELMKVKSSDGTILGRWNIPAEFRNGFQVWPNVTPFAKSVALSRGSIGWSSTDTPPASNEQLYDVGIFRLHPPSDDD